MLAFYVSITPITEFVLVPEVNPQAEHDSTAVDPNTLLQPRSGNKVVHAIMDYSAGDLANAEVYDAVADVVPEDWRVQFTPVHSFETLEMGFVFAQLALKPVLPDPAGTRERIFYLNCAPRQDRDSARVRNQGEGLVYGELENGIKFVAVNSGYSLSFVKDQIRVLRPIKVDKGGSQFRSRDNFPIFVGLLAQGGSIEAFLGDALDVEQLVPEVPQNEICYIDSFGNIKTTIRSSDPRVQKLKPGDEVKIRINGVPRYARVATGSFNVREGELAFAPGSSGWDDRFWEIFQRQGHARLSFGKDSANPTFPSIGAKVLLEVRP